MIEHRSIRTRTEAREEGLSPYAQRAACSRGRVRPEEPDPLRTAFQRDRDRILHTKAFRRLKHKTQVFIAPLGDHYVTRLTHTLEVSQIARTIARALNLNEDLTEAIALGHDLGHTPFGHSGEDVLDELFPGGFRHNEQSLRVVDVLEKDGEGLNLTWEVRDGILNHSKGEESMFSEERGQGHTLEAEVVKIADAIAYLNHDIGDAIRAGILQEEDLPEEATEVLGHSHSARINTMVTDIVETSWPVTGEEAGELAIRMSPAVAQASNALRRFMFARVYHMLAEKPEGAYARRVVRYLYEHLTRHPELLPAEYRTLPGGTARQVVDFVAGMTDQYAQRLAVRLGFTDC